MMTEPTRRLTRRQTAQNAENEIEGLNNLTRKGLKGDSKIGLAKPVISIKSTLPVATKDLKARKVLHDVVANKRPKTGKLGDLGEGVASKDPKRPALAKKVSNIRKDKDGDEVMLEIDDEEEEVKVKRPVKKLRPLTSAGTKSSIVVAVDPPEANAAKAKTKIRRAGSTISVATSTTTTSTRLGAGVLKRAVGRTRRIKDEVEFVEEKIGRVREEDEEEEEEVVHGRQKKKIRLSDEHEESGAPERTLTMVQKKILAKTEFDQFDEQDLDDPIMVSEYVKDIYAYMMELESRNLPDANYMDRQEDINWRMRGVLIDWLIDIHARFRLVPETLFICVNIIDRFLSIRKISLVKFQLVGLVAMMVACKYEEIICPALNNFLYMAEDGYSEEEFLKAELFILEFINYDLSFPTPIGFLRRISKGDDYDIKCRTFAKYFIEIAIVDPVMVATKPSLVAAASVWISRKILNRGHWDDYLTYLSTYTEEEILPTAQQMLEYIVRQIHNLKSGDKKAAKTLESSKSKTSLEKPGSSRKLEEEANGFDLKEMPNHVEHPNLHKKYQARKYHKASDSAFLWVYDNFYSSTYRYKRTDNGVSMPLFTEWKKYDSKPENY